MSKVRPIRVATPRIVQPSEGRGRPWLWLLVLAGLLAWSWQVFEFGRQHGGLDARARDRVEVELRERIAELEEERDVLRQAAARFERTGQIDRAAVDDVMGRVKALQAERADLKREVAFLKTLVSGDARLLALSDFDLVDLGDRNYRFEVTLSKQGDDAETVTGRVVVRVVGIQGDTETTLDMDAVTGGRRSQIGIKFKNYQRLKTEIAVPEGFTPKSVEVAVEPEGKQFKSFEQQFEWRIADA